ncbi:hypothetical protein KGF56_001735 [Candida oxycetoniae]|uniref:N-acetylglucosamine-induced protein 1 n=1 Tax=Candida oxycetoniae TaxID=497107 RepID=A0AAI9SZ48_9ASCO|nr:uncharacterized protein KGF56_001735 [Candida oxycetoniae]KAI3405465.2 hypothetical protein KGF56_001735 [Candida oxycetoniae]
MTIIFTDSKPPISPVATTATSSSKHGFGSKQQLETPPASPNIPGQLSLIYKKFNIQVEQSSLMPQPSKIKHGKPFSWCDIEYITNSNQLEIFARSQEQTSEYHSFKQMLKDRNISINEYILKHELQWNSVDLRCQKQVVPQEYSISYPQDLIFFNRDDIKILFNKFPYYFDTNIVHLCIWSKLKIPNDVNSLVGDISKLTRKIINRYLEKLFTKRGISMDQVKWFKNWTSLQSVRSISHIHVIIRDVDREVVLELVSNEEMDTLDLEDYKQLLEEPETRGAEH